ncbi:glycosyltransferase [Pseudanabaena sp. FACHB-1998]|uniref:glycosyltransferase family 2 protein n=1 Tax=Pseudanabaena sp. FACHB-1998 TaxID=2692858 RepID=UPI001681230F|nr:glycosyltransferase family 2 protein [Pseudanabaena sp. FACHB-1998]MBD2176621.1 glycosyltransferase [Pseudanabaena sp. FACHB-1998]
MISIAIPDLKDYCNNFLLKGVSIPLKCVPFSQEGLLKKLPSSEGKSGWPWTIETSMPLHEDLNLPKISIVIPSYNQCEYIEECIRSVLLQNYPNLELIIFDGGSNDGTREILEKYSPWISFWQSEKDNGQGHAINLGFSIASGEYFGWINSDDFYLPHCLYKVAKNFLKTDKDFIYGDSLILNESDKSVRYDQSFLVLDRYLRFGGIIPSHSSFWKSSIHQPIWEELNCAIDAELWMRLLVKKTKSHIKHPLAIARVQSEAKSVNERYKELWKADYEEKIWKAYEPAKMWKFKCYEFRHVQKIYKKFNIVPPSSEFRNLLKRDDFLFV